MKTGMGIFDLILRFCGAMFELFWFGKKSLSNKLSIYIKSYSGRTLSVNLDPKWDIKNVKEVIGPKLGLSPDEVKIIFAGKELDDSTVIEDCDLGEQSILHAVRSTDKKSQIKRRDVTSKPLNEAISEFMGEGEGEKSSAPHFRVYCSSPCESITRGKLRVRCSVCLSGAITVDADPNSWKDVLEPKRITGICEEPECSEGVMSWAEFYFKCGEHPSGSEGGNKDHGVVPLTLIRINHNSIPCLACTDILESVLVFPCGHTTCLECFGRYCSTRLRERQFVTHPSIGYTLPCPVHCPDSYIVEPHHFRILDKEMYAQYQKFGAEEWVLKNGGVLCPQPGCGAGILPDECSNKVACINGCGYVFCRNCLQGYHIGECSPLEEQSGVSGSDYSVDPLKAAEAQWDRASKVTIKTMTKPCPKCRTATERAGGCMHMVCTRCSLEWCWVCQTEWTRNCMGEHWFG